MNKKRGGGFLKLSSKTSLSVRDSGIFNLHICARIVVSTLILVLFPFELSILGPSVPLMFLLFHL